MWIALAPKALKKFSSHKYPKDYQCHQSTAGGPHVGNSPFEFSTWGAVWTEGEVECPVPHAVAV